MHRARQSRELALADRAVTTPSLLHSAQDPCVRPACLGENNRGKCLASSVVPPSSLICPAGLERDRPSVNVRRDRAFLHLCFLPLPILSSQEAVCAHSRNPRKEPHERQSPRHPEMALSPHPRLGRGCPCPSLLTLPSLRPQDTFLEVLSPTACTPPSFWCGVSRFTRKIPIMKRFGHNERSRESTPEITSARPPDFTVYRFATIALMVFSPLQGQLNLKEAGSTPHTSLLSVSPSLKATPS